ncbi:peroxide stress protein YaaA [uncultured Microbacterium sp.]|uniref:YaaA family protein n=1 Tax=uncultured Microbacterium sp. TaxID=191216 RepID=UPI0028D7AF1A|nr:peroxide stress protein YaaA [uncultured Microbacterium sp.]
MLVLLPPSETKRSGGGAAALDLHSLSLPELTAQRHGVLDAVERLSADPLSAARVLGLGRTQLHEVEVNARVRTARTMAAIDRYTGVLYDALDAASLDPAARRWLGANVLIQTALLGPVGALDRIPAYRLGASASLPGSAPLRRVWAGPVTAALATAAPRFVLDLRSEAYAALGPVPVTTSSVYVRVVTEGADGAVRALNHFNKHAKGGLVRALAQERPRIGSLRALREWADRRGLRLRAEAPGEVELFA